MEQEREYPFEHVEEAEEELEELGYSVHDLEDEELVDARDIEEEVLRQFEKEGRI